MTNPAVERLLKEVSSPVLRTVLLHTVPLLEPILVERVPDELLAPLLILATVGREYGEKRVDDYPMLRGRTENESYTAEQVVHQLLSGASLRSSIPSYPPSATANCGPGEIQLHYLPIGARFHSVTSYGSKLGTLVDKSHCRATVIWEGNKRENEFTGKHGETVHFESSSRTGCALESPVVPIYSTLSSEDVDWITNAYKELTGAFVEPKKGKRRG